MDDDNEIGLTTHQPMRFICVKICMECQSLFFRKNKKISSILSSAEFTQRVNVKIARQFK